jgi:preprotein translocase subunit SecA
LFSRARRPRRLTAPPRKKNAKKKHNSLEQYKWRAVVTEVQRMHAEGRPVLVGTTSVEKSEILSAMLDEAQIPHRVLNAKPENVEKESEIVAQSGRRGAVTLSTNMAGRGTDILLGGNPDFMARLRLREALMPRLVSQVEENDGEAYKKKRGANGNGGNGASNANNNNNPYAVDPKLYPCSLSEETERLITKAVSSATGAWGERSLPLLEAEDKLSVACERGAADDPATLALRAAFNAAADEYRRVTDAEKAAVQALGGLHVVGTERHESRRIDNQLRGRSGRQGDPGSTRFFLSLEDPLFRVFGGDRIKNLMVAFRVEDLPMESQMLTDALDTAQKRVESYFYDIRKNLFDYDQVSFFFFGASSPSPSFFRPRPRRCVVFWPRPPHRRPFSSPEKPLAITTHSLSCSPPPPKPPNPPTTIKKTPKQVVNTQRDRFYGERRRALLSASLDGLMREYAEKTVDDILEANVDKDADPTTWRLDALAGKMSQYCPLLEGLTGDELAAQARGGDFERLRLYLRQLGAAAYEQKCEAVEAVEPGLMAEAQRFFLLTQMDAQWKEHLAAVKFLQQSVGLRGYAQRDPLTEFKLEGFNLFVETLAQIRRNVIYNVYCFVPQRLKREEDGDEGEGGERTLAGAGAGAAAAGAKSG